MTATFTGLFPGAQVFAFFIPPSGGPEDAVLIDQTLSADAAGSVTLGYVAPTTTPPAGYSIEVGDGLDVVEAAFTVVAAAAPSPPGLPGGSSPAVPARSPVLAATGADFDAALFAGSALLILGAGLALVSAGRPAGKTSENS